MRILSAVFPAAALTAAVLMGSAVCAVPAAAQVSPLELDNIRAQQAAAQRQSVAIANEAMAQEARLRTEQAILDLENQRVAPALPTLPYAAPAGSTTPPSGAKAATTAYPSMPDKALADSNRQIEKIRKHRH
ncbi:MAG: hypothetical protein JF588_00730 [Caulobacterales bacterium]|nr:hypothetical protein [Caulobacterales bacterium]